jgi:aromatic-L-amino-acid/L-tryptophan decarboxylase
VYQNSASAGGSGRCISCASLSVDEYPLEPGPDEMRALVGAALELLMRFVDGLPAAPTLDVDGAFELARELRAAPPPEEGVPLGEALSTVERAAGKAIETAGPGYLAYIPGGGLFTSAVGEWVAQGLNRYTGISAAAPGLAAIETGVIDWLSDLFELPDGARGILTTGGSLANFSAVVCARSALAEDLASGTVYASEQAHHSIAKAIRLAGFPAGALRLVPCDDALRMDPVALEHTITADRAEGRRPCLVVASAGTTNTGAIDPLPPLVEVAEREGLWLHVDAAYGGFFQLTDRGRERFAGIGRVDSITLDPHKGMFLPYGTGCLLVRDGERLRRAHSVGADYLQDLEADPELPNFADHSPELTRANRGLRLWLPLQLHGVGAFRRALDEKLDLAEIVYERLSEIPELVVPWRPELSTVAFRLRDRGDEDNRRLLERINDSRRIFLSSTVLDGRFTLRVSILSHRTHRDRIEEAVEIIGTEAARGAQPARA